LEAEVAELADVVGDPAAAVAPPLVVARAEVGAAHGGLVAVVWFWVSFLL
jgi:hypothetical protein